MEALIEDSIEYVMNHEDSQRFIGWICQHIDDYYTGPDIRQGGLFSKPAVADPNQVILEPDMLHALAVNLATMIWNSIPLPSNQFKPQPMPVPKRNDPCHCGSGKKYKQCCARLPAIPTLSADEIWPIVFEKLDKENAARSIRENHVPVNALSTIAYEYLESDQPKKAAALLAPLFDGKIRKTSDDAEYALTLLCNAYDDLGHNKKKTTLLQDIIDNVARSPLRSGRGNVCLPFESTMAMQMAPGWHFRMPSVTIRIHWVWVCWKCRFLTHRAAMKKPSSALTSGFARCAVLAYRMIKCRWPFLSKLPETRLKHLLISVWKVLMTPSCCSNNGCKCFGTGHCQNIPFAAECPRPTSMTRVA